MRVFLKVWVWAAITLSLMPVQKTHADVVPEYRSPLGQEMRRYRERQLFLDALKEARTGKLSKLRPLLDQLANYPLKPYLEYEALKARAASPDALVLTFFDNHPDLPISKQLLAAFSQYRMRQGRPESFLKFYRPGNSDEDMRCYHAAALWELERVNAAMQATKALWLKGESQPKRCDVAFVRWRKQGGLTSDLAWRRWELATLAGEGRLARYLERYLSAEQRARTQQLMNLLDRPGQYSRYQTLDLDAAANQALIDHAIRRVTKKTPDKALSLIATLEANDPKKTERFLTHYQKAALQLIRAGDAGLATVAVPDILKADTELLEAEIIARITSNTLAGLQEPIALLPAAHQKELRWQYWRARALISNDEPQGKLAAERIFQELAVERDYYGHMAALWLKQPTSIADRSSSIPPEQLLDLAASPAAQRMIELRALGDVTAARREWFMLVENFSDTELRIASALASQWQWHNMAIATLSQIQAWDEVKIRFPMAYSDLFAHQALKHGVPMPLAMAVARRESGFWREARSPVGAKGLMQLMPATARLVAKKLDLPASVASNLNDPAINIQLGTAYLGQMLQRFNDNRVLALAAYNAGPGRVDRWRKLTVPLDAWIESIPFKETRAYVKTGLLYAGIYRQLNGGIQPIVFPREISQFNPDDQLLKGLLTDAQLPTLTALELAP